ncbi:hypothetical protein [Micromonospora haikouensis]|uniref:hypothetical protein n=1 Tax=Micromonospora haikouensis TaxID=686309 RepID=UPI003D711B39
MVERPHDGRTTDGRLYDGDTLPQPPRPAPAPPITRRQWAAGWICTAVVLVLLAAGILGAL